MKRIQAFILLIFLLTMQSIAGDVRGFITFGEDMGPPYPPAESFQASQSDILRLLYLSRSSQQVSIELAGRYARRAAELSIQMNHNELLATSYLIHAQAYFIGFLADSGNFYFDKAFQTAVAAKDFTTMGYIKVWRAITSLYDNEQGKFFQEISQGEEWFRKAGDHEGLLFALYSKSRIYFKLELTDEAEAIVEKALKMIKEEDDPFIIDFFHQRLSEIYTVRKDFSKAIQILEEGLPMIRKSGNRFHEATHYRLLGITYIQKGDYGSALDVLYKAYEIYHASNLDRSSSDVLTLLANVYRKTKQYDLSVMMNYQARKLRKNTGFEPIYITSCINSGNVFLEMGNYDSALFWLNKGYDLALRLRHISSITRATGLLTKACKEMGDYDAALRYMDIYTQYNNKEIQIMNRNAFQAMSAGLETERLDGLMKTVNQENQRRLLIIYLFVGLGLLVLIGLIFLFRLLHSRRVEKASLMKERLLRTQMNPHFIFNALIAIQSFIYRNNPREASLFLTGFSNLIRLFLTSSQADMISVSDDLSIIRHYLDIQKLRYNDKFYYTIYVDPTVDLETTAIPPMLIQPFLENSIEHGFNGLDVQGHLNVKYLKRNEELVISVADNGIGFAKSRDNHATSPHQPMALAITRERLAIINRRFRKENVGFRVTDNPEAVFPYPGTYTEFTIPLVKI